MMNKYHENLLSVSALSLLSMVRFLKDHPVMGAPKKLARGFIESYRMARPKNVWSVKRRQNTIFS